MKVAGIFSHRGLAHQSVVPSRRFVFCFVRVVVNGQCHRRVEAAEKARLFTHEDSSLSLKHSISKWLL
ncbi:hypothetical protein VNO80_15418 [Phaseolus coccineus]|uniref:Uncharacterized protein n=1 Tax=Phaseolus coccineus TaxID=3886 RepID=A0AAN9MQA8_PHACN